MYPDCKIVVPIREPLSHANSLKCQHERFSSQQDRDQFILKYMSDIGHFEFGKSFKPFCFGGIQNQKKEPESYEYWLTYWIAVNQHLLDNKDDCVFVLLEDLCVAPVATMERLLVELNLENLDIKWSNFFEKSDYMPDAEKISSSLIKKANYLYNEICKHSI